MTRIIGVGASFGTELCLAAEKAGAKPEPELGLEHWLMALGLGLLMLALPKLRGLRRHLYLHISARDKRLH